MTDKREVTASNGAVVAFDSARREYAKNIYLAELRSGFWPSRDELLSMADGGGDYAAYFGGSVDSTAEDNFKRVAVFTD